MSSEELGPRWNPEPEELAPGRPRYWLRSKRFGVAASPYGGWSVVDAEGCETHGDLIEDFAEAKALAERCEEQPEPPPAD